MKEIKGDAKCIRALLGGKKFSIDYYQREYRWQKKQVKELLDDLCTKFSDSYVSEDERSAVENYEHYFLGSIIISDRDGLKYIVDGQQRLTTLTLLLVHIYRSLTDDEQKGQLADLIYSQKFGKRSFNLDIEERQECMDALFKGESFDDNGHPESIVNIIHRFQEIEEHLPNEMDDEALPYFADWLIENVHLVEITAYSDEDAYSIFETMNDRGLSLTPTEMLKGYLLANIKDMASRNKASKDWRERVEALHKLGKDEDADSIKAWLRSQYANSVRERKRGASPGDFDQIGTEFHRWVHSHEKDLELTSSMDFGQFITKDFKFYSKWYENVRKAADNLTPGLESVFYNAQHNFTLQYPVLLAPLNTSDSETEILRKLRIAAKYIDILIARHIWNWKSTSYTTMQYNMFKLVILNIRGKSAAELAAELTKRLNEQYKELQFNDWFRLHGQNGRQVHRLLARITDYLEVQSGQPSRYLEYSKRGKDGYEVEHIWANHPELHMDEFGHATEFSEYRNRIGGLLLLPKKFNASYGDKPYKTKCKHYFGQNLLAKSLHENAYEHHPGFTRFAEAFKQATGVTFQSHAEFKKADLDQRQKLYRQIAEQIWNPANLHKVLEDPGLASESVGGSE